MISGVPQGSILGPLLHTAYVTLVGRLIASYGVHYHEYTDDNQLFTKMSVPATAAIGLLQDCVEALQYWFWNNGLLLNPSKSAIVYFGTRGRLRQSILPSQIIAAGSTQDLLTVPRRKTVFGSRQFSVAAPRVWNSLPQELRNCETLDTFKKHLKTHLFRQDII